MILTDTLSATVIFGIILFPGLSYRTGRRHRDSFFRKPKEQEPVTIALSGLGSTITTFTIFAFIRWMFPNVTPDIGQILRDTDNYIAENIGLIFGWSVLLLFASSVLAYLAGRHLYFSRRLEGWVNNRQMPFSRFTSRVERIRSYMFPFSDIKSPSWDTFFKTIPGELYGVEVIQTNTYVKCYLTDSSIIAGRLHSYSHDISTVETSAIFLTEPIAYQDSPGAKPVILQNMRTAMIQGYQIKFIVSAFVHYSI